MSEPASAFPLEWAARVNRFRRVMFVDIDQGALGVVSAVTSNLSRRGLAIIGESLLEPGDRAWIGFGDARRVAATVVWRDGRRLGFQFDRELNLVEYFGTHLAVRKRARMRALTEQSGVEV